MTLIPLIKQIIKINIKKFGDIGVCHTDQQDSGQ
jgi:hypothetical protein